MKDGSDLKLPAISSNKILDHLERIRCDINTRIGYLEMSINEAKDTASLFHDELIKLHLNKVLEAMEDETNEQKASRAKYGLAPGDIVELTEQYHLGQQYGYVQPGEIAQVLSIMPNVAKGVQVQVMFLEFDSTTTRVPLPHIRQSSFVFAVSIVFFVFFFPFPFLVCLFGARIMTPTQNEINNKITTKQQNNNDKYRERNSCSTRKADRYSC